MSQKILIVAISVLALCLCLAIGGTGILVWQWQNVAPLVGAGASPTSVSIRLPTIAQTPLSATPLAAVSSVTADALARTQIPPRDLYQLNASLRKKTTALTPAPTLAPRTYKIGDHNQFFVTEEAFAGKYRTANATLQAMTAHSLFWVEDGMTVDPDALQKTADYFEKNILPADQKYFGTIPTGLDGDVRVHVFCGRLDNYTAGYFSSVDTYPITIAPYSNERHLINMNLQSVKLNTDSFFGTLAHELQHLIHNAYARHNTGWIDEGMGNLAIKVNGLTVDGLTSLSRGPDTQLNTWADDPQETYAHYAASYLFFEYAAERFGADFIRAVIAAPGEGIPGVQTVLDQRANGLRFEDLFADWAVTNYLNDPAVANGRYAYTGEPTFRISRIPTLAQYPATQSVQTPEYSASYQQLSPASSDVTVYFTGTTTTKLLPVDAHGGKWMWYSNRADVSDMTLTRQFDLTKVTQATLQFSTWYTIEPDFDYAYVEVSMDAGKTWNILPNKDTTTTNPNGGSYGPALTGNSGVSDKSAARWVQEQVDLSAYAGKTILLRFEYVTDDAVNLPGWAIDDITIPQIAYADDVESGDGGWQAAGFIRTDNILPQRYTVQLIETGNATRVVNVPLDSQNRARVTLDGFGKDITKAVLVVTPFAPTTTEPAEFQFSVLPK